MTKFTKILAAVALLWLIAAQATPLMAQQYDYDFQVGQLFYKKQKDVIHKSWVTVVPQKSSKPHYSNELTGTITIPATVVNGGNTYSVEIIGRSAFEDCSRLTSINIPNGVWIIRPRAFENCSGLTSITLPNSVTNIEARTFYNCSGLTSINIPSGLIVIEADAFSRCSGLTSITLPNSVKTIGACAFSDCSGLTSINIPNSVEIISQEAFNKCTGLKSVTVSWQTPLAIDNSVFEGVTLNNVKLIVPRGKKAAYRAAEVWEEFNPIVEDVDHTITYNQPTNGTLKVKSDTQEITSGSTVKEGTILTIEATPDQHYKLDSIRVNGKRLDKLSITVEENTRIEAFFGKEKYTVKSTTRTEVNCM